MFRTIRVALALAAILSGSLAIPAPVKIVGPSQVDVNKLVRLSVESQQDDAGYIWDISPEGTVDAEELPGGRLIFTGSSGEYRIRLRVIDFKSKTITTSRIVVVIGTPVVPPGPTDPLWPKLKAAYEGATETNKADLSTRLYGIYAAAGSKQGLAYDTALVTTDAVHAKLTTLVGTKLQPNELQGLRRVIGDELNAVLPKMGTLSTVDRDTIAFQFNRIAGLLDALTP